MNAKARAHHRTPIAPLAGQQYASQTGRARHIEQQTGVVIRSAASLSGKRTGSLSSDEM
jgi:hypothetical protein